MLCFESLIYCPALSYLPACLSLLEQTLVWASLPTRRLAAGPWCHLLGSDQWPLLCRTWPGPSQRRAWRVKHIFVGSQALNLRVSSFSNMSLVSALPVASKDTSPAPSAPQLALCPRYPHPWLTFGPANVR